MEGQVEKNERFRRLLLFAFNQGSNATRAARDICAVYGDGATADRIARDWCAKFKNGTFDLRDAPSGRPAELDEERLKQLLHENSRQTTTELTEKMLSHCHGETSSLAGKGSKVWSMGSACFSVDNKNQRATIFAGLLARHRATHGYKQRILYRIVTGEQLL
ncbi:hypothetical protein RB195_001526 [Necator americanus]|uniref:Mos1 transposase HTH domain-containing protein n=1 Tax=Necator americanus TaxID=51031 RepID=A0ABR1DEQ2_NECAM